MTGAVRGVAVSLIMRGMSKIVLAVSERWVPDSRVDAIADFAARLGDTILAVHVAYGTEPGGASGEAAVPGEKTLEQITARLKTKGVKTESLLLFSDDLGAALLHVAEEHKASLIILGLAAKGMLTRLLEGNIAQSVIRSTKVPVLLLPPEWAGEL